MNPRSILHLLGILIAGFGVAQLLPAFISWIYADGHVGTFLLTSAGTTALGLLLYILTKGGDVNLTHRDGFIVTVSSWFSLCVLAALPFYFTGATPTLIDAIFESTSGLTTTGATVMANLSQQDHGIMIWRALIQWLGGMGMIVLAVAILPFLGVGGLQLYRSELPGLNKDKLRPRLKDTASQLWIIYAVITLACMVAYFAVGMNLFESIVHAFTTVSTGGFSTRDASIAGFDSFPIEVVAIVFMLVGSMNSAHHFLLFNRLQVKQYLRDEELQFWLRMWLAITVLFAGVLMYYNLPIAQSWRDALFTATSMITTTGFATVDFGNWPQSLVFAMLCLVLLGGCAGSTAGGFKAVRVLILLKLSYRELVRLLSPQAVMPVKLNQQVIPLPVQQAVWGMIALYFLSYLFTAWALQTMGMPMLEALSAAGATLTSFGPGFGDVGPSHTYAWLSNEAKILLSLVMVIGRLEIFTVFVLFTPAFWRR